MSDRKFSQLPAASSLIASDIIPVVTGVNTTPTSKRITVKALFGAVSSNTNFSANVTVSGNKTLLNSNTIHNKFTTVNNFIVTQKSAPSSNNTTTAGWTTGEIRVTPQYLYYAANSSCIKRIAWSTF